MPEISSKRRNPGVHQYGEALYFQQPQHGHRLQLTQLAPGMFLKKGLMVASDRLSTTEM